jgi:hypothetical protein
VGAIKGDVGIPEGAGSRKEGRGRGESGAFQDISPLEASACLPVDHPIADGGLVNLPEVFRSICAWCGLLIHPGTPGARISHDCCLGCAERIRQDNAALLRAMGVNRG